jgi:radical SAM superfamily enzyme YgiQ (UPF0313 family)
MAIHLINPSEISFGTAVMVCRWLYVLAGATPDEYGTPIIVDETLEPTDFRRIQPGDVVAISVHTLNAARGYAIGRVARRMGAHVIFGGVHASLFPEEAFQVGDAHSVVMGDGDLVWRDVLADCQRGQLRRLYAGGKVEGDAMAALDGAAVPQALQSEPDAAADSAGLSPRLIAKRGSSLPNPAKAGSHRD